MVACSDVGEMGDPWTGLCCGVMAGMLILLGFGLDMPKPGAILSDQCRMFANLFMMKTSGAGGGRGEVETLNKCLVPARRGEQRRGAEGGQSQT